MSSNRDVLTGNALIERDGRTASPVLLPEERALAFVQQFNQTYRSLGWVMEARAESLVISQSSEAGEADESTQRQPSGDS